MINRKKPLIVGGCLLLVLAVIVVIAVVFTIKSNDKNEKDIQESGVFKKYAVSTTGRECSKIGASMLEKNGSAVDAAIAALLCEGVASLHSTGLGGGFLMTIWDAKNKTAHFLNARETAPSKAFPDMFHGNASLAFSGGLSIAVPGELAGYWEAHQKFGKLNWTELFEPTIELCETGSYVNDYLDAYLKRFEKEIKNEPTLKEILIDPKTGEPWKEGDRIKRPKLAKTLRILSGDNPMQKFYDGSMTDDLVKEIKERDGIIVKKDFQDYKVKWDKKPIEAKIGNYTMYTAPLPGSGVLLAFMMNVLEELVHINDENIMWQRIIETFKWAYAKRTELGDDFDTDIEQQIKNITEKLLSDEYASFVRKKIREDDLTHNDHDYYGVNVQSVPDSGTSHVSVLAPDGSAISVTATINQVFGSLIRSKSTGIIFNDEMDDFSAPNIKNGFDLPPSPNNFIKPGKRPLSSMTPAIFLNPDKSVRLIIGAAGGTKITTAVAMISILNLWKGKSLKEAIDRPRIHHQLFPMEVSYETGFSGEILQHLSDRNHNITKYSGIGSAANGISKIEESIKAVSDHRRGGTVSGL